MSQKPQRIKTASGLEIIDMGALFDNEAADGVGPATLSATGGERAAVGTIRFKTASGLEIIDMGAIFNKEAAEGVGLATLSARPQRIKIAGRPEFVDLGAVFDNEAAEGVGLATLSAIGGERAADGTIFWKVGAPLIVGVIENGKLK
jgi:hypothetical protein